MDGGATVLDRAEAASTERERGLDRGCAGVVWVLLGLCWVVLGWPGYEIVNLHSEAKSEAAIHGQACSIERNIGCY